MTTINDLSSAVRSALSSVNDPEIGKPITELGMVRSVDCQENGLVNVGIDLTTEKCPMRTEITNRITKAIKDIPGTSQVIIDFGVMNDEQRKNLRVSLRGGKDEVVIPFSQPGNTTRILAIASGKGGVGKSTVTANIAFQLALNGLKVGIVDADIYGHSIPRMLGNDTKPVQVDNMIIPPVAHGIKFISIAQFTANNSPVVWRGPMLHRALQQFLADVFWGDLDFLLLDLPPGTGDIAISIAQLIPQSEIVVVTTPQTVAAEVAERAGSISTQTRQKVVGVIENMSYLELEDGSKMELFGSGGGQIVADSLTKIVGSQVPLLGQIPMNMDLRVASDSGIMIDENTNSAASQFSAIAKKLMLRKKSLAGMQLGIESMNSKGKI